MQPFGKPLEQVTAADITALPDNGIAESHYVEFKLQIPDLKPEKAKREFLKDVTAFANASGGAIILGIRDDKGVAQEIVDVGDHDFDKLRLQLEAILHNHVDPTLPLVEFRDIATERGRVFVVAVRRSWRAPHMITYPRKEFWVRATAGALEMSVDALRSSFLGSLGLEERLLEFRSQRLARLLAADGPAEIKAGPMCVVHIVPYDSLTSRPRIEAERLSAAKGHFLADSVNDWRFNFDGFLVTAPISGTSKVISYTQLLRDGSIERVETVMLGGEEPQQWVPGAAVEQTVVRSIKQSFAALSQLAIAPPVFVLVSLLRVHGLCLANPAESLDCHPIDRPDLVVPSLVAESISADTASIALLAKPALNTLWQASGFPASPYFNGDVWRFT